MSSHVNNLMSLLFQLSKACARVEDEDAKASHLSLHFESNVFTKIGWDNCNTFGRGKETQTEGYRKKFSIRKYIIYKYEYEK